MSKNEVEKYISFSKDIVVDEFKTQKTAYTKIQLRFINSFKFESFSLDKLVKDLDPNEMHILKKFFPCDEERNLLSRKGFFPYDWYTDLEKLNLEHLPQKDKFYNLLNDKNISDEDYEHAYKVFNKFCKNMREYHDLYMITDVILLADVFENFRKVCKNNYNLDPAWYYTSPGLAWDAMLKLTKVKLELLHDPQMYLMVKAGIRGGTSTIFKRYAKANNSYMGESFDPEKEKTYIQYLDVKTSSCERF